MTDVAIGVDTVRSADRKAVDNSDRGKADALRGHRSLFHSSGWKIMMPVCTTGTF